MALTVRCLWKVDAAVIAAAGPSAEPQRRQTKLTAMLRPGNIFSKFSNCGLFRPTIRQNARL
jgi:hypothetical protein